jgi:hypothetical protein
VQGLGFRVQGLGSRHDLNVNKPTACVGLGPSIILEFGAVGLEGPRVGGHELTLS